MRDSQGRPVGGPDDGADDDREFVIEVPDLGVPAPTGADPRMGQAPDDGPALIVDGPTVIRDGHALAVDLDDAMLHDPAWRWSVGYGWHGCPDELVGQDFADRGVLLLPARVRGFRAAWEARRSPVTGRLPVVLVPHPGFALDAWAMGVHAHDAPAFDGSDGRGASHNLARVGTVVVADRWLINPGLARCAAPGTVLLTDPANESSPLWLDLADHVVAAARLDADAPTVAAPRASDVVPLAQWPITPLTRIPR